MYSKRALHLDLIAVFGPMIGIAVGVILYFALGGIVLIFGLNN